MKKRSLYSQHRATFHIFPAMIPLIEILPWLLTLVGTLAGGAHFFESYIALHKRFRVVIYVVMTLSFVGAGGLYLWEQQRVPDDNIGSQLTAAADLPALKTEQTAIPPYSSMTGVSGWLSGRLPMAWVASSKNEFLGSPVIAGNLLIIGTFSGMLEARSLVDGALVWTVQKQQPIFMTPLVDGQNIYVGEGLHTADVSGLTALSAVDGKPLWERKFGNHIESSPAVDNENNRLWTGAGGLGLWSLDTRDGSKIWWAKIGHIDVAPLYTRGQLFAAAKLDEHKNGSAFFELNPDDGKVISSVPMDGNPMGRIMDLDNGKFLVSTAIGQVGVNKDTDAGWLYGVDMRHSKPIRWITKLSTMGLPEGQLSKDRKQAFFALKNGDMIAVDTGDGRVLWTKNFGKEFKTDVDLFEDGEKTLVIGHTTDGIVHIVDASDGHEIHKLKVGTGSYSAPLYANGVLYITTPHSIHAYHVGVPTK